MNRKNESQEIYLDFNASTPVDPGVAEVMQQSLEATFGNPSSLHWAGRPARQVIEQARQQIARLISCSTREVIFTSGGSEANNFALKGVAQRQRDAHIITTRIEHPAIVEPCKYLERHGARITWLGVDANGQVDPGDLRKVIGPDTTLVSIMHANSEVGTIQPIAKCAQIAHEYGVPFHTDAAQSVGKIPVNVNDLGVDMLSIAGHKLYAPKGIGALYVREGVELEPLIHGADHEAGRRAGTESTVLTSALGKACELAGNLDDMGRVETLRDRFWSLLHEALGARVVQNGLLTKRLPNTLHLSVLDRAGGEILAALPQLAASTGSACHADAVEMSSVLRAMGFSTQRAAGAIRFSLGRFTTKADIETAAALIIDHLTGAV